LPGKQPTQELTTSTNYGGRRLNIQILNILYQSPHHPIWYARTPQK